jgi:hypothetical protein
MLENNVKYNIIDELVWTSFKHDVTYLCHNICCQCMKFLNGHCKSKCGIVVKLVKQ